MAINWQSGDSATFDIIWQEINQKIPVNKDKELTKVTIECIVQPDGIPGYFDELSMKENLSNARLNSGNIVYIPTDGGTNTSSIAFAALDDNTIQSAHIVFEQDVVCDNYDNYIVLSLGIAGSDTVLATKTLQEKISARTIVDFGPINTQTETIPQGTVLKLDVKQYGSSAALPKGMFILVWSLS